MVFQKRELKKPRFDDVFYRFYDPDRNEVPIDRERNKIRHILIRDYLCLYRAR